MSVRYTRLTISFLAVLIVIVVFTCAANATAVATAPIKEVPFMLMGDEVDETTKANVCLIGTKCQPGTPSATVGGFEYPEGVAGAPNGNVYVADSANNRVQEFTGTGEFVLMFGKEVDSTTNGNVCTAVSGDTCKAGVPGAAAGQLNRPTSIVVDPVNGNVYVVDLSNKRVEEFTAGGVFVLSIEGSLEHGPLTFEQGRGNLLAVGGGEDLLYVGEQGRVQEFEGNGKWKGEITVLGTVRAIAVDNSCSLQKPVLTESTTPTCKNFDPSFGDLYLAYENTNTIQKRDPAGNTISEPITVSAKLRTIATDSVGRVAAIQYEETRNTTRNFGALYDGNTSKLITEFAVPATFGNRGSNSIGFGGNDELYATAYGGHEVVAYKPEAVAELITDNATCEEGAEHETSVTFECTLNGETNPFNVPNTEIWFEWGATCALGAKTLSQSVGTMEELVPVSARIGGLRPNELYCYQIAGVDQNVQLPEDLTGEKIVFKTPSVPPKVFGEPTASFVNSSSALMYGELNPEHTSTEFYFEYAADSEPAAKTLEECKPATTCTGVARTLVLESGLYGKIGVTLEATGLKPSTTYHFRLTALNETGQSPPSKENTFTTTPAPTVQAETLPASAITATSALASGLVNPDGQPAVYTFELGIYNGETIYYATVFSGQTGANTTAETKEFTLTGLQPGTTYAYRITIHSGYGTAQATPTIFTTNKLPETIPSIPPTQLLPTPPIKFPKLPTTCKHGTKLDKHHKCTKPKHKRKTTHKK